MAQPHTDSETSAILTLLGGPKVFPRRIRNASDLQRALREGFPFAAFDSVQIALEFKPGELAELVGVASRTLARRKKAKQLSPIESDRLYRVAHVLMLASDVLGSLDAARAWLQAPNQALGGESPVSLLDTEIGERQVEDVLSRIDHGVLG
jgi:putative toxin-antitoxin system antitoxin component (TIGR02293 family)